MKNIFKTIIIAILKFEAKLVLKKYKPKIVAVTGSVGKTSTKDAIFTVLSNAAYVRKSEKSFNHELGIPLTILGCPNGWNNPIVWIKNIFKGLFLVIKEVNYPSVLVLEVGVGGPGDIKRVGQWISPDVVVVTRLGEVPVHVEFFSSPAEIKKEKAELVKALKPDGLLILNADDKEVLRFREFTSAKVMTYGFSEEALVRGSNPEILYGERKGSKHVPRGITFKANYSGNSFPVKLTGLLGYHHAYPALAALAVGVSQGRNMLTMIDDLLAYGTPNGRMKIIEGIKHTTIIDDTYNASPVAVEAALDTLNDVACDGKKIAVLGDMLELGKWSAKEHRKIGILAGDVSDLLILVGPRSKWSIEGATEAKMDMKNIQDFDNSLDAGKFLQRHMDEGDVVLIKGSQSMRMERTVEEVMAHPEAKKDLLVRQDPEWLRR